MRAAISYALMSLIVAVAAVASYVIVPVSNAATIGLGFMASVLAGAGILAVYPALMSKEVISRRQAENGEAR